MSPSKGLNPRIVSIASSSDSDGDRYVIIKKLLRTKIAIPAVSLNIQDLCFVRLRAEHITYPTCSRQCMGNYVWWRTHSYFPNRKHNVRNNSRVHYCIPCIVACRAPLLCDDRETGDIRPVSKQRLGKHFPAARNRRAVIEVFLVMRCFCVVRAEDL
jgi:hypothetical protein